MTQPQPRNNRPTLIRNDCGDWEILEEDGSRLVIASVNSVLSRAIANYVASEKQPRWISVKERMPDIGEPVVYARPDGAFRWGVGIAYWTFSECWNPERESTSNPDGFTHWMPLPEAPK